MNNLRRLTGYALLGAGFVFCTPLAASANGAEPAQTAQDNTAQISAIESYFNAITTMQADFTQAAPDGSISTGKFYLNRPGRLRFEYDKPITDFIVADGSRIYFYDGQMDQVSQTDIGNTLADFLLRPKLSLSGELQVSEITHRGELLWVTVVERSNPDKGRLSLALPRTR